MNSSRLPPSLDKDLHTIEEEVAYARSLTPEERLVVLARICRADYRLLQLNRHKKRLLEEREPVPESTVIAFERLGST